MLDVVPMACNSLTLDAVHTLEFPMIDLFPRQAPIRGVASCFV
jgi:hypothetical protein